MGQEEVIGRPNMRVKTAIAAAQSLQRRTGDGLAHVALREVINVLQSDEGTDHPRWAAVSQVMMQLHAETKDKDYRVVMAGLSALE